MVMLILSNNLHRGVKNMSEDKKRVVVTLSADVAKNFDDIAKKMGLSKSGLVTVWTNDARKDLEQKK